jgi:hypothetical protein
MDYTEKLKLNKPEKAEQYNIDHWNENSDTIDTYATTETNERKNADSDLQEQINAEVNDRKIDFESAKKIENHTGLLTVERGGTGMTTAQNAIENLLSEVPTESVLSDSDSVLFKRNDNARKVSLSTLSTKIYKDIEPNINSNIPIDVYATKKRWLRFDFSAENKKTIKIIAGTKISVHGAIVSFDEDTSFDFSTKITGVGKDYYLFLNQDGELLVSQSKTEIDSTKVSEMKVRFVGQFHTECVDVGDGVTMTAPTELTKTGQTYLVKNYDETEDSDFYAFYNKDVTAITTGTYYNVATMEHPLSGFSAGDILPESVWCISFHPNCAKWDGMVYDRDMDIAVDVYLQSGTGKSTASVYGATHTVSRQQPNHASDMISVGKTLLSTTEFTSIALGSNEKTNIVGSADKSTVGGHADTAGRRMTSAIGCEECCGYLWQWLTDQGTRTSGQDSWTSVDGQGSFGQHYAFSDCGLCAGGHWDGGWACGSRSRASDFLLSSVGSRDGARGRSVISRE